MVIVALTTVTDVATPARLTPAPVSNPVPVSVDLTPEMMIDDCEKLRRESTRTGQKMGDVCRQYGISDVTYTAGRRSMAAWASASRDGFDNSKKRTGSCSRSLPGTRLRVDDARQSGAEGDRRKKLVRPDGRRWAICAGCTGCRSGALGKGFAQFVLSSGETAVHEIVPHRTAQYRTRGRTQDKTDHTDALAMARLLHAEPEHLPLVQRDDASTALRLLSDHRDNLVAERTRLVNHLHAQMLQIDPCYAERSGMLTSRRGIRYCHTLTLPHADGVVQTRLLIVRQLTEQLLRLWEEIETVESTIAERVRATEPPLLGCI